MLHILENFNKKVVNKTLWYENKRKVKWFKSEKQKKQQLPKKINNYVMELLLLLKLIYLYYLFILDELKITILMYSLVRR